MTRSVLILGAAGLIGTALRTSLGQDYRLLSVDRGPLVRLPDGHEPHDEVAVEVDLTEPTAIDALFDRIEAEGSELAGIIDLVAYYDFKDRPDDRYRVVEEGLRYLLTQMERRVNRNVPFIYASSMAAMAPTEPGRRQTPDSPRLGAWQYPAHKLRCEEIIESRAWPQPRVELVLAAVYTPWCELVPLYQQIERVRRRSLEAFFYPGPVARGLTYAHVDDVAETFRRAIEVYSGVKGVHRLLVGEEEPVTYEFIHRVASERMLGMPIPTVRIPKAWARAGAALLSQISRWRSQRRFIQPWMVRFAGEHFEFDIEATKRILGWTPKHALSAELFAICDRAMHDPQQWRRRNEARPW